MKFSIVLFRIFAAVVAFLPFVKALLPADCTPFTAVKTLDHALMVQYDMDSDILFWKGYVPTINRTIFAMCGSNYALTVRTKQGWKPCYWVIDSVPNVLLEPGVKAYISASPRSSVVEKFVVTINSLDIVTYINGTHYTGMSGGHLPPTLGGYYFYMLKSNSRWIVKPQYITGCLVSDLRELVGLDNNNTVTTNPYLLYIDNNQTIYFDNMCSEMEYPTVFECNDRKFTTVIKTDNPNLACQPCSKPDNCKTSKNICIDTMQQCTVCEDGYYLEGNECLDICEWSEWSKCDCDSQMINRQSNCSATTPESKSCSCKASGNKNILYGSAAGAASVAVVIIGSAVGGMMYFKSKQKHQRAAMFDSLGETSDVGSINPLYSSSVKEIYSI